MYGIESSSPQNRLKHFYLEMCTNPEATTAMREKLTIVLSGNKSLLTIEHSDMLDNFSRFSREQKIQFLRDFLAETEPCLKKDTSDPAVDANLSATNARLTEASEV